MEYNEETKKQTDEQQIQFSSLRSGNSMAILETISEIRRKSSVSILNELFEVMLVTHDEEVKQASAQLLNDLKNEEAIPVIMDAIKNTDYYPIRRTLIESCWQSGLDYHEHIMVFLEIAAEGDYATTLEAFTVVEDNIGEVEEDDRKQFAEWLQKKISSAPADKQLLLTELILMINRF